MWSHHRRKFTDARFSCLWWGLRRVSNKVFLHSELEVIPGMNHNLLLRQIRKIQPLSECIQDNLKCTISTNKSVLTQNWFKRSKIEIVAGPALAYFTSGWWCATAPRCRDSPEMQMKAKLLILSCVGPRHPKPETSKKADFLPGESACRSNVDRSVHKLQPRVFLFSTKLRGGSIDLRNSRHGESAVGPPPTKRDGIPSARSVLTCCSRRWKLKARSDAR